MNITDLPPELIVHIKKYLPNSSYKEFDPSCTYIYFSKITRKETILRKYGFYLEPSEKIKNSKWYKCKYLIGIKYIVRNKKVNVLDIRTPLTCTFHEGKNGMSFLIRNDIGPYGGMEQLLPYHHSCTCVMEHLCKEGRLKIIKYLFNKFKLNERDFTGFDVNTYVYKSLHSPINICVDIDRLNILRFIIKTFPELTNVILLSCIMKNKLETVIRLLSNKSVLNKVDLHNEYLLSFIRGDNDIRKYVLSVPELRDSLRGCEVICMSKTKKGEWCKNVPQVDSEYCKLHQ